MVRWAATTELLVLETVRGRSRLFRCLDTWNTFMGTLRACAEPRVHGTAKQTAGLREAG